MSSNALNFTPKHFNGLHYDYDDAWWLRMMNMIEKYVRADL